MLAKTGWRIWKNPESLLALVLRDKYFPGQTFQEARLGRNSSWGRKGLIQARIVMGRGVRWRVRDGGSIRICEDP